LEPNRAQAGTIEAFVSAMNTSPSKVGIQVGAKADATLQSFSQTEGFPPLPTKTPYFNMNKDRYVYTEKAGWVDMVHFLFYAGEARKQEARGSKDPVGDAVRAGQRQEFIDQFIAKHSAYSYEDLPTDKVAAIFGADVFDPASESTLGAQIKDFLADSLGATSPSKAPNWSFIPSTDHQDGAPTWINKTTEPMFTSGCEKAGK
jgi:hypothetical protein